MIFLTCRLLPFLLNLSYILTWVFGHESGSARMLILCFFSLLTSIYPRIGLWMGVASFTLWDIPILRLGYRNQFFSDGVMLAIGNGLLWNNRHIKKEQNIPNVISFFLCLGVISLVHALSTLNEIYHFIGRDFFSWKYFFIETVKGLWDWNMDGSWAHPLSVITAYFVQVYGLFQIYQFLDQKHSLKEDILILPILIGITCNSFYAISQYVGFSPIIYTVNMGGFRQNGNLLSFLAGLGLIIAYKRKGIHPYPWAFFVALFLGRGRLSMLALTFVFLFSYSRRTFLIFISSLVSIVCLFKPEWLKTLFFLGGRETPFYRAWSLSLYQPFRGIGIDTFFHKSGLNIEPHNLFLEIALNWGWPLSILCLCFSLWWLTRRGYHSLKNPSKKMPLSFCIGLYCFIIFLGDHPYSYRGILSTLTVLMLFQSNLQASFLTARNAVFLGLGLAIPSLISTQSWLPFQGFYEKSLVSEENKSVYYMGPFFHMSIPTKKCLQMNISSFTSYPLTVIPTDKPPNLEWDLDHIKKIYSQESEKQIIELHPNKWSLYCSCNADDKKAIQKLFYAERSSIPLLRPKIFLPYSSIPPPLRERWLSLRMKDLSFPEKCP